MILSPASRASLEFDACLAILAQLAATDLGRARLKALQPTADRERLELQRQLQREVAALPSDGRLVPSFEEPLQPLLDQLEGRAEFSGLELLALARMLGAALGAIERAVEDPEKTPALAERCQRARSRADLAPLVARIERTLDPLGNVRDDASPKLRSLRSKIKSRRESLYRDLTAYLHKNQEVLGDETVSVRDGRLLVLLPSGHRGRLPGLVHGRSSTGRSFYFEPLETVESNNDLQQAIDDEGAERRRLLLELTGAAADNAPAIAQHARLLGELDALEAAQRFSELTDGRLAEISRGPEIVVASGKHPLLDPALQSLREWALGQPGHGGTIVPLELSLATTSDGEENVERVLVVTGPNAGGKTVALKTVGLLCALHQCGLPVPAQDGTRLPIFERIVAVVGDDQDMLMDRSTFSGRLLRLEEAWTHAGQHTLVLLDEVGSGTNPEEGAALSIALLEKLVEGGSTAVLVTHLTQVASAALDLDGAGCGAMAFDGTEHRPTFSLVRGAPGGSEALSLAERLGLSKSWLDRASALLSDEHRSLRGLLRQAEQARDQLNQKSEELSRLVEDNRRLQQRSAAELTELERERKALKSQLKGQLESFKTEVRADLGKEAERLKKDFDRGQRKNLAAKATARLFENVPEELVREEPGPEAGAPGDFSLGDTVRHSSFGWQGTVEAIDKNRVTVSARGKTLRCQRNELARVETPSEKPKIEIHRSREPSNVALEINLVGERVEPALDRLDAYLDTAMSSSAEQVRVIHGHGTGRLRTAVREHLRSHPAVATAKAADAAHGGNGATVVTFKS